MSYEQRGGILFPPPFHAWFGLSYSHYLVLPRSLLEAMPHDWQERAIALLDEMRATFDHNADYMVKLRGEGGRFLTDPLANYRHPDPAAFPWRKREGRGLLCGGRK